MELKTGWAASKSPSSPPQKSVNVPSSAEGVLPETGESRHCTPASRLNLYSSREVAGDTVLISIIAEPRRRCAKTPCGSVYTLLTASSLVRDDKMTSASDASSAMLSATVAPYLTKGSAASRLRLYAMSR